MSDSTTPHYLFIKENVSLREYKIYKYLDNMNFPFIPKLYRYDKISKQLTTQRIIGLSVADYYGEGAELVPTEIMTQIREIIVKLYNIGIIYPDITGYNFIIDKKSKVWIVDFEHCFYLNTFKNTNDIFDDDDDDIPDKSEHIQFVTRFAFYNENNWNTYFA